MKKWIRTLTAAFFLAGTAAVPIYAAQPQEIIQTADLVQTYDEASGRFIQRLDETLGFSSTIPQGLITSGGVGFDHFSDEIVYVLERNGKDVKYESGQIITESGQYHLQLLVLPQLNLKGMEEPSMEQLENDTFELENLQILDRDYTLSADFYFTITGNAVSQLNYIQAPAEYQIAQIYWYDEPISITDRSWYRVREDGNYKILFHPVKKGLPEYETVFTKDTKPPLLTFEGVAMDGSAKRAVQYTSSEENGTVEVYREGHQIQASGELRTPGLYRLIARDQAGNCTSYLIHIKNPYPFILLFLILGGFIILASGMYLIFRHQKITVR